LIMDGIAMRAVLCELRDALSGGRVDRIHQPEPDLLVLHIRNGGISHRLLLSASANNCRLHLTQAEWKNPLQAPKLCMLLRKRLIGARLAGVEQDGLERIARIRFEGTDELGRPVSHTLVTEIMGRHSNVILVGSDGRIVDSVKRVPPGMSRVRQVLPGLAYAPPPAQDKLDPLSMDARDFTLLLASRAGGALDRYLSSRLTGVSRQTAADIVQPALPSPAAVTSLSSDQIRALAAALAGFFQKVRSCDFSPTLISDAGGVPAGFAPYRPAGLPDELLSTQPCMSRALELYYLGRERKARIGQKAQALVSAVNVRLERSRSRLALHEELLAQPNKGERYRRYGELLTANLDTIKKGERIARVTDYHSPEQEKVDIELDERLSPARNAQRYFRLYAKHKSALDNAIKQAAAAKDEIAYYEGLLFQIGECTETEELEEIRSELENAGVLRAPTSGKKKKAAAKSKPLRFTSSDGFEMRAGRNNAQNDELTLRWARPGDVWLHAKDIPGSHVVIRTGGIDVPESTLLEAATLAALHSAAKNAAAVPVDHTLKKYVKKPGKAAPGMVIYTHQKTFIVRPDPKALKGVTPIE
jgi:predicted ribosome quality control (RQC) complex YloA/Tae2 family protein